MSLTRNERLKAQSAARREQQKLELRERILEAASELFLEHGYSGFSLRQVAEKIGYSPTTVYLYFENKDDLLFEVSLEGFEKFRQTLEAAYARTTDPVERLTEMGRAYIAFGIAYPAHYRLMFLERGDFLLKEDPGSKKPAISAFDVMVRAVQEAHAAGVLRSGEPMDFVYSLWAGVHGLVSLRLCVPPMAEQDIQNRAEHLLTTLHSGFAKNPLAL
jgi:AcrR family transcriptional regulator